MRSSVSWEVLGVELLLPHISRSQLKWLCSGCLQDSSQGRSFSHVTLGADKEKYPGDAGGVSPLTVWRRCVDLEVWASRGPHNLTPDKAVENVRMDIDKLNLLYTVLCLVKHFAIMII